MYKIQKPDGMSIELCFGTDLNIAYRSENRLFQAAVEFKVGIHHSFD